MFNVSAGRRGRAHRIDPAGRRDEQQPDLQRQRRAMGVGSMPTAATPRRAARRWPPAAGLIPMPVPSPILPPESGQPLWWKQLCLWTVQRAGEKAHSSPPAIQIGQQYVHRFDRVTPQTQNNQFNALLQYQFRKLYFTSGYARLEQGFSHSGTPARGYILVLHRGITLVQLLLRGKRRQSAGAALVLAGAAMLLVSPISAAQKPSPARTTPEHVGDVAGWRTQPHLGTQLSAPSLKSSRTAASGTRWSM